MAPSATTEEVQFSLSTTAKVGVAASEHEIEKHAHGGEGKTPLEAISQGPLIHAGEEDTFSLNSGKFWWIAFIIK